MYDAARPCLSRSAQDIGFGGIEQAATRGKRGRKLLATLRQVSQALVASGWTNTVTMAAATIWAAGFGTKLRRSRMKAPGAKRTLEAHLASPVVLIEKRPPGISKLDCQEVSSLTRHTVSLGRFAPVYPGGVRV